MKRSSSILKVLSFAIAINLFSCKGKEGAPGPVGPAGPKGEAGATGAQGPQGEEGESYNPYKNWNTKEGFITGTLIAATQTYGNLNYDVNFQGVFDKYDNYMVQEGTKTRFHIAKAFAGEGETFKTGYISFDFTVDNLTTLSTPKFVSVQIDLLKEIGNDSILTVERYQSNNLIGSLSNLTYDGSAKTISGDFSIAYTQVASQMFSLNNGKFSTKLTTLVQRKGEFQD